MTALLWEEEGLYFGKDGWMPRRCLGRGVPQVHIISRFHVLPQDRIRPLVNWEPAFATTSAAAFLPDSRQKASAAQGKCPRQARAQ